MRKKIISELAIILFLILAAGNNAFAEGFDAIYTVGSEGSTTPKDTFGWNEQPWLYLRLPDSGFNITLSFWKNPDNKQHWDGDMSCNQDIWHTLKHWDDIKKLGEWRVSAKYFQPGSDDWIGCGHTNFTVTPEPLSSILFLIGGVALAARLRRIKNPLKI